MRQNPTKAPLQYYGSGEEVLRREFFRRRRRQLYLCWSFILAGVVGVFASSYIEQRQNAAVGRVCRVTSLLSVVAGVVLNHWFATKLNYKKARERRDIPPTASAPLGMWQSPMSELEKQGRCAVLAIWEDGTGWSAVVDESVTPRRRECHFTWQTAGRGISVSVGGVTGHTTVTLDETARGADKIVTMTWEMEAGTNQMPWVTERPMELVRAWFTAFDVVEVLKKSQRK